MGYNKETGMYEGYIYKIINDINDKVYIGQTTRTIEERFKEHLRCKNDNYIHKAIRKYGKKHFACYEIEKIKSNTKEELINNLNDREIFWIDYYKSINKSYNESLGGDNAPDKNSHEVDVYLGNGIKIDSCKSYTEASYKYKVSYSSIKEITSGKQSHVCSEDGIIYVFRDKGEPFDFYPVNLQTKRYIYCFNTSGIQIARFCGSLSAAEILCTDTDVSPETKRSTIDYAARNKTFAYGYFWSTEEYFDINQYYTNRYGYYQICQYDKYTKKLINTFRTIKDASFAIKGNYSAFGAITKCCKGKCGYAFGYIWRYDLDPVEKFILHKERLTKGVKINRYSIDDCFIDAFNSCIDGAENIGIKTSSSISSACKSKSHISHGYKWYYANDPNQPDKTKIIN